MREGTGDEVDSILREAFAKVMHSPLIGDYTVLATAINPDGEPVLEVIHSPQLTTWTALGMIDYARAVHYADARGEE